MTEITRKDFLGLSAAAVTSAVLGKTTSAHAMQVTAATGGTTRPTHIRGADLLTMDPTLQVMRDTDVLIENGRISAIGKRPGAGRRPRIPRARTLIGGIVKLSARLAE